MLHLSQHAPKETLPPLGEIAVSQVIKGTDGLQDGAVGHANEPHGAKKNTVADELLQPFPSLQVLQGKPRQSRNAKNRHHLMRDRRGWTGGRETAVGNHVVQDGSSQRATCWIVNEKQAGFENRTSAPRSEKWFIGALNFTCGDAS